jgi:hypothetical protein
MNFEDYTKEKLWSILLEIAHALIMYPYHKAYTKEAILTEKPHITPEELAVTLKIPLGEALAILYELAEERKIKS